MRLRVPDQQHFWIGGRPAEPDAYAAIFSPDGRLVAVGGKDGVVQFWDATKFDVESFIAKMKQAKPGDVVRLWDEAVAARPVGEPLKHDGPVVALAFSPDGKTLLAGCGGGTGQLWDVASCKRRRTLKHQGPVVAVAFSGDGAACVTGSWDGTARIWRTETGELACPPLSHQAKVLAVDFSRDGRTVLTGSEDWTARLWDAATGQPIGPPLRHHDRVRAVAFSPDSRTAVTAGDDRTGRLWRVPAPAQGPTGPIRDWVMALTGSQRAADGSSGLLDRNDWEAALTRLGDPAPVAKEDPLGWHRQQARADETAGRWQAARWHLDRLVAADPQAGPLYLRRGRAVLALNDLAAARRDLDKAVALLPAAWEPWFQRGRLALHEQRWQDGINDLGKALELRKPLGRLNLPGETPIGTAAIQVERGFAHASLGHWKEAAADYAIIRSPFQQAPASAWPNYALVLLKQGDAPGYAAACKQMLTAFANPQDEPRSTIVTFDFGRQEVYTFGRSFDPQAAGRWPGSRACRRRWRRMLACCSAWPSGPQGSTSRITFTPALTEPSCTGRRTTTAPSPSSRPPATCAGRAVLRSGCCWPWPSSTVSVVTRRRSGCAGLASGSPVRNLPRQAAAT